MPLAQAYLEMSMEELTAKGKWLTDAEVDKLRAGVEAKLTTDTLDPPTSERAIMLFQAYLIVWFIIGGLSDSFLLLLFFSLSLSIGSLLALCWLSIHSRLALYWLSIGSLQALYRLSPGSLQALYWFSIGSL
jgi:hypothetical protein